MRGLLSFLVAGSLSIAGVALAAEPVVVTTAQPAEAVAQQIQWKSFITAEQLHAKLSNPDLLLIDARSAEEFQAGHLPGAISIPGEIWRTPDAKPGKGNSQYIFLTDEGKPDVARYERLLSQHGVTRDHDIVVYGNHAGKTDGSVPAMILHWLGHPRVTFLDGVGPSEWQKAGYSLVKDARELPASQYSAQPIAGFVWSLDEVVKNLDNEQVVFYDTRSSAEYEGRDRRSNARGGHIPGAVLCDFAEFLDSDKRTLPPEQVREKLAARGITPDKQVVLYCQTATRVSLPILVLRDLGYTNVSVYDASWHEYGNREDTPIASETRAE